MSTASRWGAAYGALWSLAPGILSELLRQPGEALTVILSGVFAGILTAFLLAPALASSRLWRTLLLGLLSLPLGAGLFGFIISWVHWAVLKLTGVHYRFVLQIVEAPGYIFAPLRVAKDYALHSTLSPLALVFIPLAILTTLHLRRRIIHSRQPVSL